jgi:exopolysaccharide production protein ExoQ
VAANSSELLVTGRRAQNMPQAVDHFAFVDVATVAAASGLRDHRRNMSPFRNMLWLYRERFSLVHTDDLDRIRKRPVNHKRFISIKLSPDGPVITRLIKMRLEQLLLSAALFVLIFSNDEQHSVEFQFLGVIIVCVTAFVCVLRGKCKTFSITILELIMFTIVFCSYVSSIINGSAGYYTIIFTITYVAIMLIVRSFDERELIECIFASIALSVVVVAIFYYDTIFEILQPGAANRWELRLSPFGMHPDLTGYVYGGFLIIIIFSDVAIGRVTLYLKLLLAAICLIVVVAASARAALIAMVFTLIAYTTRALLYGAKSAAKVLSVLFVCVVFGIIYSGPIVQYLSEMLELDSSSRGLDTGGSGRIELWQQGVNLLANRNWELFIGSGLRSSSPEIIGFSTESSYITIIIESGMFVGLALLLYMASIILRRLTRTAISKFDSTVLYLILFAMTQSIFNRYLIAIGNPMSLIVLMFISKESLRSDTKIDLENTKTLAT